MTEPPTPKPLRPPLREFLYVDTDKTRALLAQLDDGIIESVENKDSYRKRFGGGLKAIVEVAEDSGKEEVSRKSTSDALFLTLEQALEADGELADISEQVANTSTWENEGSLEQEFPSGSIVRITAAGFLFDSSYFADSLSNFAAVNAGLANLSGTMASPTPVVPPKARQEQRKSQEKGALAVAPEWPDLPLEARIPMGGPIGPAGIDGRTLRGLIQMTRGLYNPGLNLQLFPCDGTDAIVSCRLQEGRRYLDSEKDVLFARYGVVPQEWTVVGYIGQYPRPLEIAPEQNFMGGKGNVIRAKVSKGVHSLLQYLGTLGFADLAQPQTVSVVPLAVYRYLNPRRYTAGPALDLN